MSCCPEWPSIANLKTVRLPSGDSSMSKEKKSNKESKKKALMTAKEKKAAKKQKKEASGLFANDI
jgi:hypothetical protein